jgi:hypothetical protein
VFHDIAVGVFDYTHKAVVQIARLIGFCLFGLLGYGIAKAFGRFRRKQA